MCIILIGKASHSFVRYEWDTWKNRQHIFTFNTQMVDFGTLSPAYVIPAFSANVNPTVPKVADRFYFIPLSFTDQSDWEVGASAAEIQKGLMLDTIAQELAYMKANQTSNQGQYFPPTNRAVAIIGAKRRLGNTKEGSSSSSDNDNDDLVFEEEWEF